MKILISEEDETRYNYYFNEGIQESDLSPYDRTYIVKAITKIPARYKLLKDYKPMITTHENEIMEFYSYHTRKNLLHYILKDPKELKRLRIQQIPCDYPVLVVRAPVPWHNTFCVSQQLMEKHFYNGNIVVLQIRDLWENKYVDMMIIPDNRLEDTGKFPLEMEDLERQIDAICDESRRILVKEWLPSCADVFLKNKSAWKKYIPMRPSDSPVLVERFFDCVNGLLSMQLRSLVMRSLEHFLRFLVKFKVTTSTLLLRFLLIFFQDGNDFGSEYQDMALINLPVIKVTPRVDKETQKIVLHPPLTDISEFINRCFNKILEVNRKIPKIENIMFPGLCCCCVDFVDVFVAEFASKETFLFPVLREELPVEDIFQEGLKYFDTNLIGPLNYLKMYDKYLYILEGEAENEMLKFFEVVPFPFLKDFAKKIYYYADLRDEMIFLRRSIPLNFISLECGELNDTLYNIVDNIRSHIVNYFITENHDHNRK